MLNRIQNSQHCNFAYKLVAGRWKVVPIFGPPIAHNVLTAECHFTSDVTTDTILSESNICLAKTVKPNDVVIEIQQLATWLLLLELSTERLQFVVKPKDARLAAGSDVTIACSAPGASLSWRRVGVAVLPGHVTSEEGKLRLRGVKRSDAGLYVCTATASDHSQSIDTTIRIDITGNIHVKLLSSSCKRRQISSFCHKTVDSTVHIIQITIPLIIITVYQRGHLYTTHKQSGLYVFMGTNKNHYRLILGKVYKFYPFISFAVKVRRCIRPIRVYSYFSFFVEFIVKISINIVKNDCANSYKLDDSVTSYWTCNLCKSVKIGTQNDTNDTENAILYITLLHSELDAVVEQTI